MGTEPLEPLVDVKKVEEVSGMPRTWLYAAAEDNRIPSYKVGKYRKFRLSEIETWLTTKRHGSEPGR